MKIKIQKIYAAALVSAVLLCGFQQASANDIEFDLLWSRSAGDVAWMGASTERGMAYHDGKLYVASRGDGAAIRILNAETGADIGSLDASSLSGGALAFTTISVTEDGVIFASNLTANASTSPFKIYMWTDEEDETPETIIEWTAAAAYRMVDNLSVAGSVSDGSAVIYAAVGNDPVLVRWTMELVGDGYQFVDDPEVVPMASMPAYGTPAFVAPMGPGAEYGYFAGGRSNTFARSYTGEDVTTGYGYFPDQAAGAGNAAMSYQTFDGIEYLFFYKATSRKAYVHELAEAGGTWTVRTGTLLAESMQMGETTENISGDIAVADNGDGSFNVYVLATNNGIYAYNVVLQEVEEPGPLAGDYYIPKGANQRGFADLLEAIEAINEHGLAEPATLLIDDDIDHSDAQLPWLERDDLTEETPLHIRPAPGKEPVVSFTGAHGLAINNTSWITIDGDNGSGGHMTFHLGSASGAGNGLISITSLSRNIMVTNLVMTVEEAGSMAIRVRQAYSGTTTTVPGDLTFSGIHIGEPGKVFNDGFVLWSNDAHPLENVVVEDNIVFAARRGITTIWLKDNTFRNNEFHITGDQASNVWHGGIYLAGGSGDMNIYGNHFMGLGVNGTGYAGAILLNASADAVNIFNNFIAMNIENKGENTSNKVYGIVINHPYPGNPLNIMHNTILIPDDTGLTGLHAALGWERDTIDENTEVNLANNIMVNMADVENAYGIEWPWATGIGQSDYNNIYVPFGSTGFWNDAAADDLAAWHTATGQDENSVAVDVEFVSNTDLSLTGSSIGNLLLAGVPLEEVPVDIFGNERSEEFPYMGAFEGAPFVFDFVRTIAGTQGWKMLSFPAVGVTVEHLAGFNQVQGIPGVAAFYGESAPSGIEDADPNLAVAYQGGNWYAPADISEEIMPGTGVIWYMYDNAYGVSTPLPFDISVPAVNAVEGDVMVALHSTTEPIDDGEGNIEHIAFNLLGNPFSSDLDVSEIADWASEGAVNSAVVQVWQNDAEGDVKGIGHSGNWVLVGGGNNGDMIAPWQGFMLENDDADELVIPESANTGAQDADFFKQQKAPLALLGFTLKGFNENANINTRDGANLMFSDRAEEGWDIFDATKLTPLSNNFATIGFVGERRGVQVLKAQESRPSDFEGRFEIPMAFETKNMGGEFTISWNGLDELPDAWQFTLVDNVTGDVIDLRHSEQYSFTWQSDVIDVKKAVEGTMSIPGLAPLKLGSESEAGARFTIVVNSEPVSSEIHADVPQELTLAQNYPNPFNPSTTIAFTLPEQSEVRLAVYDVLGRRVAMLLNESRSPGEHMVTWDASTMASGVYIYRLEAAGKVITRQMTLVK